MPRFGSLVAPICTPFIFWSERASSISLEVEGGDAHVEALFVAQTFYQGERAAIIAEFDSGAAFTATSAQFTLYAAGSAVSGYSGVSATVTPDPLASGRRVTVSAELDLSSVEVWAVPPPGRYRGEFLLTLATGEIHAAIGEVVIRSVVLE